MLTLGLLDGPGVVFAQDPSFLFLEPDVRSVPWSTISRLALESGKFPPLYRSLSQVELAGYLRLPGKVEDPEEEAAARWWRGRYLESGGGISWRGCECKEYPYSLRLQGRILTGYSELGDVLEGESGLVAAPGWNLALEPTLDWSAGVFWATVSARLQGRLMAGGSTLSKDDPLSYPSWPLVSGPGQTRQGRLASGPWLVRAPQALAGVRLGSWSLNAGWAGRRVGPGLGGTLVLDHTGASFAAMTARRTEPFRWSGIMSPLAPDILLLRSGLLSERQVRVVSHEGDVLKTDRPWFMQWLIGWEVTRWFRASFTQTTMAATRDGSLWLDLPQINFPVIGTTWRERESGPVTDRLFAALLEFRWGRAPWPLLPADAGRLYWDYGGTDFLPTGPWGVIPQISLPASVAGVELVSPVWDLALEYTETRSAEVLWYTNSGFPEGFTHRGWLLGHPLGGGAEAFSGLVRWRPGTRPWQAELKTEHSTWLNPARLDHQAKRSRWALALATRPGMKVESREEGPRKQEFLWRFTLEYLRETAPAEGAGPARRHWWRSYLSVSI